MDTGSARFVPKAESQVTFIEAAFDGRVVTKDDPADKGIDFMYEKGVLLVLDEYLDRVIEIVTRPEETAPREEGEGGPRVERVVRGVSLLSLRGSRFTGGEGEGVIEALEVIDAELGEGAATPNHVLTVSPVIPCPANEPGTVTDEVEPEPGPCSREWGEGVRVYVADTGLAAGSVQAHSWLAGVHGEVDPIPIPPHIPPYVGHGTFVAGVLKCMAPSAEVFVANVFDTAGSALESDAVPKLEAALGQGYDLINLTASTKTRKDLPLLTFDVWRKHLRQRGKGIACVVAAGNNDSHKPFWPAAFPGMVAVGALAADGRHRAAFSNHGGWVDVYAPGRDLVNAYASGTYTCIDPPFTGQVRYFHGMCRWSGTSFSTPIVTGLIAARMSRTGENGREAAAAMLAFARSQAIPGVGAVLLPCQAGCDTISHKCGCSACGACRPTPGCH
ncbi:MAG TPA: S8/S53 family peptidase [Streptosporangiaceae bacterium]|nr:S8/S53 family peptidase [Streptosporangiaceae bacterium]